MCDYSSAIAIQPLPACHAKHIFNFEPVKANVIEDTNELAEKRH
jgi:hypothetical protein